MKVHFSYLSLIASYFTFMSIVCSSALSYEIQFKNNGRNISGTFTYSLASTQEGMDTIRVPSIQYYRFDYPCPEISFIRFDPDDFVHFRSRILEQHQCEESPQTIIIGRNSIGLTLIGQIIDTRQIVEFARANENLFHGDSLNLIIQSLGEERVGAAAFHAKVVTSEISGVEEFSGLSEQLTSFSNAAAIYAITEFNNSEFFIDVDIGNDMVLLNESGVRLIDEFQRQQQLEATGEWDENSLRRVMLLESTPIGGFQASGLTPLRAPASAQEPSRYFPEGIPPVLEAPELVE